MRDNTNTADGRPGGLSSCGSSRSVSPVPASIPDAGLSLELRGLLDKLKEARGPDDQWVVQSNAVSRFVAGLNPTTRVFCYGEVRLPDRHYPAVLTFNTIYRQTLAWAPSGKKGAMQGHHEVFFHSTVPHQSIAREVFWKAQGMEARQGGDEGSVHDSPVAKGHAPECPLQHVDLLVASCGCSLTPTVRRQPHALS